MNTLRIGFITLFGLISCLDFGSYDQNLDPGRILWPKETWFGSPIELSQNNAGSSTTLTINFTPSTTLNLAIVELIFPKSFSTEPTSTVTLPKTYNLLSGKDTSITYSTTLPASPGVYGPIGIVTRMSSGGQIVDANFNFGFFATTSPALQGSLKVSISSSSPAIKINTDNVIQFEFSLSFSFRDNDIIELVPDSDFGLKSSMTCISVGDENSIFNKNGTNILPCALGVKSSSTIGVATGPDNSVANDSLYIYQISRPNYAPYGSTTVIKLSIGNFTAPPFAKSTSTWTINIWRWRTNTLLAQYSTTTGPETTPGAATFVSWESKNNISKNVMQGQTIFTTVTVATNNLLPEQSTMTVKFSGIDIFNTIWWSDLDGTTEKASGLCYVISPINNSTCVAIDATTAKITFAKPLSQESVSFVVLSYFSSETPQVSKITTYYGSSSNIVDQSVGNNVGSFAITIPSSTFYKVPDLALHALAASTTTYPQIVTGSGSTPTILKNANEVNQGGVKGQDIFIRITPGGNNTWGSTKGTATTLTVYFPQSSSLDFDNFNKIFIGNGTSLNDYIKPGAKLKSSVVGDRTLTAANPKTAPQLSNNHLSVSFSNSSSSPGVTPLDYYILRWSSSDKTSLPFIASNIATFYEVWAIATYTVSSKDIAEIGSSVISVLIQTTSSKLYTSPICTDKVDGIPLVNYFEPINVDFDFSTKTYAIDIKIINGYSASKGFMGTGMMANNNAGILKAGTNFVSTASNATASIAISGTNATITLKNLGSAPSKVSTYFPAAIASLGLGTIKSETCVYFLNPNDPWVNQYLYCWASNSWTIQIALKPFDLSSIGATGTSNWYPNSLGSIIANNELNTKTSKTPIKNSNIVGIGLPAGFKCPSAPIFTLSVGSAKASAPPSETTFYLCSQSETLPGGFIMGSGPSWGAAVPTSSGINYNLTISNLISQGFSTPAGKNTITEFVANSTPGGACIYSHIYTDKKNTINIQANPLSTPVCTSTIGNTILGASADSINLSMIISFNTSKIIFSGGSILVTMDNSWGWPSSSYSSSTLSANYALFNNSLTATLKTDLIPGSYSIIADGVLPPSNSEASTIEKDCFTALSTRTSFDSTIESWNSPGKSPLQMKISSSSSVKTGACYLNITAYPNVPGILADISMSFYFNKTIPAGSYIIISAPGDLSWSYPVASNTIKNYCWSSVAYSSCLITSSSTIAIYLTSTLYSNVTVNVYLDEAIKFLSKGDTRKFLISAYWGSIKIIEKTGSTITVRESNSASMTLSLTNDVKTAGEVSTYTFAFTSSSAIAVGDYIYIKFPKDFDPYIGEVENPLKCFPNKYFISCSSVSLGSVTCAVDHWYLIISGNSKSVDAQTSVNVTVYGVKNPGALPTDYFKIFHYDTSQILKASLVSTISVNSTSPARNLNLKTVISESNNLASSSNYKFDFYPALNSTTTFSSDNTFNIVFPQQFNLKLNTNNLVSCSAMILDETSLSQNFTSWLSTSYCSVNGNTVTLSIPNNLTTMLKITDRIRISLTGVNNPQFGLARSTSWDTTGIDTKLQNIYWSNRFELYIYDKNSKTFMGRTYGLLHSAYLNYNRAGILINVNDYKGITNENRIQLFPGQQSNDIKISFVSGSANFGMKSQKLVITPSSNPNYIGYENLIYTSDFHNWTVFQLGEEIKFRVSATSSTPPGIYYIDWIVSETTQDGVTETIYNAPFSTMVEVCSAPAVGLIAITVDSLPILYTGHKSSPISVNLDSAPASELIVTPSFGISANGISINPVNLTFSPDIQTLYFELYIISTYNKTQTPKLSFILSGTDSSIFITPTTQSPQVTSSIPAPSTTLTLVSNTNTGTSVAITAKYSQDAILYWGLSCAGHQALSFSGLKKTTQSLIYPVSNLTSLFQQLAADYQATETQIDYTKGDTDIASFIRRDHKKICTTLWTGVAVIRATKGETSINIDWLIDGTSYYFYSYVENNISSTQPFADINFTTSSPQSIYSIAVTFAGDIPENYDDSIKKILAKHIGVNPSWLITTGRTALSTSTGNSRILESSAIVSYSKFNYQVIYDKRKPLYSPIFFISQLDQDEANKSFTQILGFTPVSYGNANLVPTEAAPTWLAQPKIASIYDTNVTFTLKSSKKGIACVSCSSKIFTKITYASQVLDGLDAEFNTAFGTCKNVTASISTSLELDGLTNATKYTCYFTACNSYPLYPACIDVTKSGSSYVLLNNIKFTTTDSSNNSSVSNNNTDNSGSGSTNSTGSEPGSTNSTESGSGSGSTNSTGSGSGSGSTNSTGNSGSGSGNSGSGSSNSTVSDGSGSGNGSSNSTGSDSSGSGNGPWLSSNLEIIWLVPGQQSGDISIKLESGLKSEKVILTPKIIADEPDVINNIVFTSIYHYFTFFQLTSEITFRVLAKSATPEGSYTIEWNIMEICQDGVTEKIYSASFNTTLKVFRNSTNLIDIFVDSAPALYAGFTSIPICVRLARAPATELITNLSLVGVDITINPWKLIFGPDNQVLCFELEVASTYPTIQESRISFILDGIDSNIFKTPNSIFLNVAAAIPNSEPHLSLETSAKGGNSATITAKFNRDAVIYWALSCSGHPVLSFEDLKAITQNLVNPASNKISLFQQLAAEYQATETHIDYSKGDTDITSFNIRIYRSHCSSLWTNAEIIRANNQISIDFDWLVDGTSYTLFAYADNKTSANQSFATVNFSTLASQPVYSTSVTFSGDISIINDDIIRKTLAKNMGVNPSWLISTGRTTPSSSSGNSRFLESSSPISYSRFNYNLTYDKHKPEYSPFFMLSQLDKNGATNDLTKSIGSSPLAFESPTLVSTGTPPTWTVVPELISISGINVSFNATSSQNGTACVSCSNKFSNKVPYAWQVRGGLDADSNVAHGTCINTTSEIALFIIVSGLTQATNYTCYFTACNNYPAVDGCCIESSSSAPLININITTLAASDSIDESGGGILRIMAILYFYWLI